MEEEREINLTERVLSTIQNRKAGELREIFETSICYCIIMAT